MKHEKYASAMKYLIYNYDQTRDTYENNPVRRDEAAHVRNKLPNTSVPTSFGRRKDTDCEASAFPSNVDLTDDERVRVHEVIRRELRQTTAAHEFLQQVPGVGFKSVPNMNVTEMRRCLKHGRQRLQCNRPHAPLALCEKILGNMTLGEFGHWLQLMYHLRRFVKGLVKSCNLTPNMQAEIVNVAQKQIILEFAEPPESALWCMEYSHAHYTTDTSAPDEFCSIVKDDRFNETVVDDDADESCCQDSKTTCTVLSEGGRQRAPANFDAQVGEPRANVPTRPCRKRPSRNSDEAALDTPETVVAEQKVTSSDHVVLEGNIKVAALRIQNKPRVSRTTRPRGAEDVHEERVIEEEKKSPANNKRRRVR